MKIDYQNYNFDYSTLIKEEKAQMKLVPDAADIEITAKDEHGASGVQLVSEYGTEGSSNYYFNALVAGNKVTLTAKTGTKIASAKTTNTATDLQVANDGMSATFTPAAIKIGVNGQISGEVITVAMEDGLSYTINTVAESLPVLKVTGTGVSADDAGVYTFQVAGQLIRVNSNREVVYYRNANCTNPAMPQNFQVDTIDGVNYYSYGVKLNPTMTTGGKECGGFEVMDANYVDQELVTMLPNTDSNHTHGEGYIDSHEFRVLGPNHYLTLSYTQLEVTNLPSSIQGVNGTSHAYVWAGIFQEIKDGKVIKEINTTDYPELFSSAVEDIKYSESTGDLAKMTSWCDYVHCNSLDYTLNSDGTVNKLLVSMRDQSAVYQFDMGTGNIEWILGGKASTLSGYDDYATTRADDNGVEFNAIMFGQHYARYTAANKDGSIGVSLFDNATGTQPYMYENGGIGTHTRVLELTINASKGSATVDNCVNGHKLDLQTGKDHVGDHCGSVDYWSATSTMIGWGLHIPVDTGTPVAAKYGWSQGDHPIFTDWNDKAGTVSMELCVTNSPLAKKKIADGTTTTTMTGAYRTYKSAK